MSTNSKSRLQEGRLANACGHVFRNSFAGAICVMTLGLGAAEAVTPDAVELGASARTVDWSGLYLGVNLGTAVDSTNEIGRVFDLRGMDTGQSGSGGGIGIVDGRSELSDLTSGVHLGYQWQFDGFVTGLEGDIGYLGSIENTLGSLRGRAGIGSGNALFYGTLGAGFISIDGGTSTVHVGGNGGNGGSGGSGPKPGNGGAGGTGVGDIRLVRDEDSEVGLVAGLGAEYRLGRDVTLGLEGLYFTFDGLENSGYDEDFFLIRGRISMQLTDGAGYLPTLGGTGSDGDWSGPYAGAHAGMLLDTRTDTLNGARLTPGQAGTAGANGAAIDPLNGAGGGGGGGGGGAAVGLLEEDKISPLGGFHVGYNWESRDWLYGVEGDASFGAKNREYLASLRGRVGKSYASHLLYLTGGVAFTRTDGTAAIFAGAGGNGGDGSNSVSRGGDGSGGAGGAGGAAFALDDNESLTGFVIGAGIDTKIAKNLVLGIEGLYYGFDGDDGDVGALAEMNGSAFAAPENADGFVIRTRLSMRF